MPTPLTLFRSAPRWRITVIAAAVMSVTLLLVQPDPEKTTKTKTVQPVSTPKAAPTNVTTTKPTPAEQPKSQAEKVAVIQNQTVDTTTQKKEVPHKATPKKLTLKPSITGSIETGEKIEETTAPVEKKITTLKPSS